MWWTIFSGVKNFLKPAKHKQVRGYQFIPYRLDYLEANRIKVIYNNRDIDSINMV